MKSNSFKIEKMTIFHHFSENLLDAEDPETKYDENSLVFNVWNL